MTGKRRLFFLSIAGGIIVLDQITKMLATRYLADGSIVRPFGNDLLWFVFVQNPGLAMGMRFLPPVALSVISLLAGGLLGYYLFTKPFQPLYQGVPLALIMGGALGNMIDRIAVGQVTDFISVDMPDFIMDRFWVFNVADSAVSVGVVALMIVSFLQPTEHDQTSAGGD